MTPALADLARRHLVAENQQHLAATLATLHPQCRFDDHATGQTWHGRHIGRFLGIEPTGRTIVQPFIVVLGFRDGLMVSERFHYDLGALLRQIRGAALPALEDLPYRKATQAPNTFFSYVVGIVSRIHTNAGSLRIPSLRNTTPPAIVAQRSKTFRLSDRIVCLLNSFGEEAESQRSSDLDLQSNLD